MTLYAPKKGNLKLGAVWPTGSAMCKKAPILYIAGMIFKDLFTQRRSPQPHTFLREKTTMKPHPGFTLKGGQLIDTSRFPIPGII